VGLLCRVDFEVPELLDRERYSLIQVSVVGKRSETFLIASDAEQFASLGIDVVALW